MEVPKLVSGRKISLVQERISEAWVQERIFENPKILGLGDLAVVARERRQEKAGRLDLLLRDEENRRFVLELMLGRLDESHIIRTLEYWDNERRLYPRYEHVAVVVAEDLTSRFLNIINLFAGTVPIIALQMQAYDLNGGVLLDFVKVVDRTELREDDESEEPLRQVNSDYWENRAEKTIHVAGEVLDWINTISKTQMQLNYNVHYVGLSDGNRARNFIYFKPKQKFIHVLFRNSNADAWAERLEEAGLEATVKSGRLRVTVRPDEVAAQAALIQELIQETVEEFEQED